MTGTLRLLRALLPIRSPRRPTLQHPRQHNRQTRRSLPEHRNLRELNQPQHRLLTEIRRLPWLRQEALPRRRQAQPRRTTLRLLGMPPAQILPRTAQRSLPTTRLRPIRLQTRPRQAKGIRQSHRRSPHLSRVPRARLRLSPRWTRSPKPTPIYMDAARPRIAIGACGS